MIHQTWKLQHISTYLSISNSIINGNMYTEKYTLFVLVDQVVQLSHLALVFLALLVILKLLEFH